MRNVKLFLLNCFRDFLIFGVGAGSVLLAMFVLVAVTTGELAAVTWVADHYLYFLVGSVLLSSASALYETALDIRDRNERLRELNAKIAAHEKYWNAYSPNKV